MLVLVSCEKDAELTTLEDVNFPSSPEPSFFSLILVQEEQNEPKLTISWPEVIFPVDAPVEYSLQFDIPADTVGETAWNNAIVINAGTDVYSKSFQGLDINQIAENSALRPKLKEIW